MAWQARLTFVWPGLAGQADFCVACRTTRLGPGDSLWPAAQNGEQSIVFSRACFLYWVLHIYLVVAITIDMAVIYPL